ncbi:hypothetical protein [Mesorhizobium sp. M0684]|uniref:esterase/lipase family protein n=1 Tax=Mesorhizobium sp. M0684 TaxID=2956986 RepID=UPI00333AC528
MLEWLQTKIKRKGPLTIRRLEANDNSGSLIFFVHGIFSKSESTWKPLFDLISGDKQLDHWQVDTYEYPTTFFQVPYFNRTMDIAELAAGLRTSLSVNHSDRNTVRLVGHSLGGVVVRKFILEEIRAGRPVSKYKLMLMAAPNTGADLANFGTRLSWNQRHLKQLIRRSPWLDQLNRDWAELKVEHLVDVSYVAGGSDYVVDVKSAIPSLNGERHHLIAGCDHSTIVRPKSKDDLVYRIVRNFLTNELVPVDQPILLLPQFKRLADPLFEIYDSVHEAYYYVRPAYDNLLAMIAANSPLWLHGASGVGKTSLLRRMATNARWVTRNVMLSGYANRSAEDIFRGMLFEGIELEIGRGEIDQQAPTAELIRKFKEAVSSSAELRQRCYIVEELPIHDTAVRSAFLNTLSTFLTALQSDSATRDLALFTFSSIQDPLSTFNGSTDRIRDRMQFVKVSEWISDELDGLISLIAPALEISMDKPDQDLLVADSRGLPRFVKLVLRDSRNRPESDNSWAARITRIQGSSK